MMPMPSRFPRWFGCLAAGVVISLSPVRGSASGAIDFDTAWQRLDAANPALRAQRLELEQARAGASEARARRLPTLGITGSVTRLPQDYGLSLDPLRSALAPVFPEIAAQIPHEYVVQPRQFSLAAAKAVWPLYAGGRIRAGEVAALAQEAASDAAVEDERGELALELVRRYFGVELARRATDLRADALATLLRHQEEAVKLESEGMIARAERLRADVAVAEAQRDLSDARRDSALAKAGLAALLASDMPVSVRTPLPPLPASPALETWQRQARQHSPALAAARHQLARAEAGVRAARGEARPQVALFGQYKLHQHDVSFINPQHLTDWAVGIGLEWNLFDGGQIRSRVAAAYALADSVQARYEDGARNLDLLVEQRYHALLAAQARLQSFEATAELAEESLRAQRIAFAEGMARSLDVIDAELSLSRLRLGELAARYEGVVALAGLHQAGGDVAAIRRLGMAAANDGNMSNWNTPP